MKVMKYFMLFGLVALLSGCVVKPSHRHGVVVKPKVKAVAVLEREHNDRGIVVVTVRPNAGRKCWDHGNHWHCKKN